MSQQCPACDAVLAPEDSTCPNCGADIIGSTASFAPVDAAGSDTSSVEAGVDGPVLIVRKGPTPGERFFLEASRLTVGRDPESDIFLNDMTVSRSHAAFELVGDDVTVRDLGSLNGTYVNGVCVDAAQLTHGDVVQIGTFQMMFVGRGGALA